MIDKWIENWKFHFVMRLIALIVISVSTYAILTRDDKGALAGDETAQTLIERAENANAVPEAQITLSDLQAQKEQDIAASGIDPASGAEPPPMKEWPVEENSITVDGVLVPQKETVVSSSRDGKIINIPLENGDRFKKNDVLVRYDCADLEAEAEMAGMQKKLTETKSKSVDQLFKLDIISDVERLNVETEDKQVAAKVKMYEAQLESCVIRAEFNGIVTKRLANEGEYTRTDRVLMEVASSDPLNIEFLLPSKWLRWVGVGAPLEITVNETGETYKAKVVRIFGAIDPVSQSIQIRAALDPYQGVLLSGMSGKVTLDVLAIRNEGIAGYLSAQSGL